MAAVTLMWPRPEIPAIIGESAVGLPRTCRHPLTVIMVPVSSRPAFQVMRKPRNRRGVALSWNSVSRAMKVRKAKAPSARKWVCTTDSWVRASKSFSLVNSR